MATKETIKREIKAHIDKEGSGYQNWYVGIATDPEDRLFNDHKVTEKNGWYIFRHAESSVIAREIEEYFIETVGTAGGQGGGDSLTKSVYAYKKTSNTEE